ncbi:MAG: YihY/virulence factor BrkB family protein [Gemmatimonadales bacterium]|nr:MAG: YihY/virulence factor BrkB family protein [Gemmatimonadales bacterium]
MRQLRRNGHRGILPVSSRGASRTGTGQGPPVRDRLRDGFRTLRDSVTLWLNRDAFQLAAALAFYTLFSLAPVLLIIITLVGVFLGEEAVRGEIAGGIEHLIGPAAAEAVQDAVRRSRIEEAGILPTLLGVGAMLFGATTLFAQLQKALNRIWDVTTRATRSGLVNMAVSRGLSLLLVLLMGLVLLVSFVATTVMATLLRYGQEWLPLPGGVLSFAAELGLSVVLASGLFALVFKVLPDVRIAWRDVGRGALLTGTLFVLGQFLVSLYLTRTAPASAYGAAGSLVMILLWVYCSSLLLLFGAAYTRVSTLRRGAGFEPRRKAVRTRTRVMEDDGE